MTSNDRHRAVGGVWSPEQWMMLLSIKTVGHQAFDPGAINHYRANKIIGDHSGRRLYAQIVTIFDVFGVGF